MQSERTKTQRINRVSDRCHSFNAIPVHSCCISLAAIISRLILEAYQDILIYESTDDYIVGKDPCCSDDHAQGSFRLSGGTKIITDVTTQKCAIKAKCFSIGFRVSTSSKELSMRSLDSFSWTMGSYFFWSVRQICLLLGNLSSYIPRNPSWNERSVSCHAHILMCAPRLRPSWEPIDVGEELFVVEFPIPNLKMNLQFVTVRSSFGRGSEDRCSIYAVKSGSEQSTYKNPIPKWPHTSRNAWRTNRHIDLDSRERRIWLFEPVNKIQQFKPRRSKIHLLCSVTIKCGGGGMLSWHHWRFISQLMKKNSHAPDDWDLPPASSGLILSRLNILLKIGDLIPMDDV